MSDLSTSETHEVDVVYTTGPETQFGCLVSGLLALVPGGGFFWLGYSLGWYLGLTIAGAGAISFVAFFAINIGTLHVPPPQSGTLSFDGRLLRGPIKGLEVDLGGPHVISAYATDNRSELAIVIARFQQIILTIEGLGGGILEQVLGLSQLVEPFPAGADPATPSGVLLDYGRPDHRRLVDSLLQAIVAHRNNDRRFQCYAALPWNQQPAPTSGLLRGVALPEGAEPAEYFAQRLSQGDLTAPEGQIAQAYQEVRLWVDDKLGLTPDYVVICEPREKGLVRARVNYMCTLLPLGRARLTVERDILHASTGGTASRTTQQYSRLRFKVAGLEEPIDVVHDQAVLDIYDEEFRDHHYPYEACVRFVNSR